MSKTQFGGRRIIEVDACLAIRKTVASRLGTEPSVGPLEITTPRASFASLCCADDMTKAGRAQNDAAVSRRGVLLSGAVAKWREWLWVAATGAGNAALCRRGRRLSRSEPHARTGYVRVSICGLLEQADAMVHGRCAWPLEWLAGQSVALSDRYVWPEGADCPMRFDLSYHRQRPARPAGQRRSGPSPWDMHAARRRR